MMDKCFFKSIEMTLFYTVDLILGCLHVEGAKPRWDARRNYLHFQRAEWTQKLCDGNQYLLC